MSRTSPLFFLSVAFAATLLCATAASAATESILYNFRATVNGQTPGGGLIADTAGNLYGVTNSGGLYNNSGTVFELSPNAQGGWTETVLYNFGANGSTDGYSPVGSLTLDKSRNLYGATDGGGSKGAGTIFKLTKPAVSGQKRSSGVFNKLLRLTASSRKADWCSTSPAICTAQPASAGAGLRSRAASTAVAARSSSFLPGPAADGRKPSFMSFKVSPMARSQTRPWRSTAPVGFMDRLARAIHPTVPSSN